MIGKRVVPNELPAKANLTIWKESLDSNQREIEFYQNLKSDIQHLFPKVFYSDGFQNENDLMESFYLMLLEDVSENYYQNTSMGKCQAEDLMKCLAELHASTWGHYEPNKVTRGNGKLPMQSLALHYDFITILIPKNSSSKTFLLKMSMIKSFMY